MALSPGTQLGPYEITTAIGAGGMGEVYRAHDPRLGRDVAIKVLPDAVAGDPERLRRFEQEARAVAALSHPNILAIFDIGAGARPFLVTELLDGETLRTLMVGEPIAARRAGEISVQLVSGLAAAHARGIVHRDLKPDNIFVTRDGVVKILDFGLATSAPADNDETRTHATLSGMVVGTAGYMSPEQVRGLPVDHRTDLFAIGAVLYEMFTGRRAFTGDTSADLISSVLRHEPTDLDGLATVPAPLARIIRRCLEKVAADRFQSAEDLRFALESIPGAVRAPVEVAHATDASIAVPPFTDMSPLHDQAYFCEGMAEEIINALARVEGVRVAPRTSTFEARRQSDDLGRVAAALGVRTILEGSVRTAGNRLRATAQLVDVEDKRAIWSDRFDGEMADVFAIQDDISSRIVSGLRGRLFGESVVAARRPTQNVEAYRLYLMAQHHRYTTYRLGDALAAYKAAVEIDPTYAPALAGIAQTEIVLTIYGAMRPDGARVRIGDVIDRALAHDRQLAMAHVAAGHFHFHFEMDWMASLRSFDRALALAPEEAEVHGFLAINYGNRGDALGCARHAERARVLDPLSAWSHGATALAAYAVGDCAEAIRHCRTAIELRPDAVLGHWVLGASLTAVGSPDLGIDALTMATSIAGETDHLLAVLASAHSAAGHIDQARALVERLERKAAGAWVSLPWRALGACALGDVERAMELLEQAAAEHAVGLNNLGLPAYDRLRGHPRFVALVRSVKLPPVVGAPRS